jgi:hypothetical protein
MIAAFMKNLISFFFAFLFSYCLASGVTVPNTEVFTLKANINGITYKIFIALPDDYKTSSDRYPVLYLLDADFTFHIARAMRPAPFLDKSGTSKKAIIVGISYEDQDFSNQSLDTYHFNFRTNRMRDYMPVKMDKSLEKFKEKGVTEEMLKDVGQAEAFKNFLVNELIPYINRNYRTTTEKYLGGISNGGHFVLWIFIHHPDIFTKYIAASPAPWTEGCYLMDQLHNLKYISATKIYLSVGDKEGEIKDNCEKFKNKVEIMKSLHEEIQKYPYIQSKFEIFPDQDHHHATTSGLIRGMEYIFKQ